MSNKQTPFCGNYWRWNPVQLSLFTRSIAQWCILDKDFYEHSVTCHWPSGTQPLFISLFSVRIPNNKTAYLHSILIVITVPYRRTYARFKFRVRGNKRTLELRTFTERLNWMYIPASAVWGGYMWSTKKNTVTALHYNKRVSKTK
jgi:hypothetical protein